MRGAHRLSQVNEQALGVVPSFWPGRDSPLAAEVRRRIAADQLLALPADAGAQGQLARLPGVLGEEVVVLLGGVGAGQQLAAGGAVEPHAAAGADLDRPAGQRGLAVGQAQGRAAVLDVAGEVDVLHGAAVAELVVAARLERCGWT